MSTICTLARAVAAVAISAVLHPVRFSLAAQEQTAPRRWTGTAQANASVFFGNSEQRVLGGHAGVSRADSALEVSVDIQSLYGDASIEDGPRTVTKRLLLATASVDLRPFARLSPFVFGSAESNFEKRIASRYSVGAGAKRTFARTDRTEASVSLALMDEHTVPRVGVAGLRNQRLTRWSWRGRVRHAFDERLRLSHVTFWRPSLRTAARYVVLSTTELEYNLTRILAFTLSFIDNYDSEAVRRGARTYNDGQALLGVMGSW
jgi:hypothetical protein